MHVKVKTAPQKKQWNRKKLILLVVMEDKEGCPSAKPNLCYPSVLDPSTWRRWQAEDKLSPLPFFLGGVICLQPERQRPRPYERSDNNLTLSDSESVVTMHTNNNKYIIHIILTYFITNLTSLVQKHSQQPWAVIILRDERCTVSHRSLSHLIWNNTTLEFMK